MKIPILFESFQPEKLPEPYFQAIESLGREPSPEVLEGDLLVLARELRHEGYLPQAADLYDDLTQPINSRFFSEGCREEAAASLAALRGEGSGVARAQLLSERFLENASDWRVILPMMAGTAVYQGVRISLAAKLTHWSGFNRHLFAGTVAFFPELSIFTGLSRTLRHLSPVPGDGKLPLSHELASAALTLSTLKTLGAMAAPLAQYPLVRPALPFLGLLAAHGLEVRVGLRQASNFTTMWTDTLSSYLALSLGIRLGQRTGLDPSAMIPRMLPLSSPVLVRTAALGPTDLESSVVMMNQAKDTTGGKPLEGRPLLPSRELSGEILAWLQEINPYESERSLGPDQIAHRTGDMGLAVRAAARLARPHVNALHLNLLAARWDGFRLDGERALGSRRSLNSLIFHFANGDQYRLSRTPGGYRWETLSDPGRPISSFPPPLTPDSQTETFFISSPWREVLDVSNIRTFLKELRREKVKVPPEERVTVRRTDEGILVKFGSKDYFYGYQDKDHRFFIEGGRLKLKVGNGFLTIRRGGEELDYQEGDTHKVFIRDGVSTDFTGETRPLTQMEVREEIIQDQNFLEKLSTYPRMRNGGVRKALVSELENTKKESQIPFPILKKMGDYYQIDVRSLISAANPRTLANSGLDPELAKGPSYPIYLENPSDLLRLKTYSKGPSHRGKGSLGWLIWYLRKNPFCYETLEGLARKLGVSRHILASWEFNKVAPNLEHLEKLSRILGYPLGSLIQARNQTHFSEIPWLDLFGNFPLFYDADPKNGDQARVHGFLSPRGSLGQFLWVARKLRTANVGVQSAETELGITPYYFRRGETHQIPPLKNIQHLTGWLEYFQKLGMPENLIKGILKELFDVSVRSSHLAYLRLVSQGDTKSLAGRAGISHASFLAALHGEKSEPRTLAAIKEAFPEEDVGTWYREQYPFITQFFPEAADKSAVLHLSSSEIDFALRDFSLAEHLFEHRLNAARPLDYKEMATTLGISTRSLMNYEKGFVLISDDVDLVTLSRELNIDPKILYLHYRPEILGIFPVRDPASGEIRVLDKRSYQKLVKEAEKRLNRTNMRSKLEPIMRKRYPRSRKSTWVKKLAKDLAISTQDAQKYFNAKLPLGQPEILRLSQLPEISYQEWYEHFFRAPLVYFLGRENGKIDYSSSAAGWSELESWDIRSMVLNQMKPRDLTTRQRREVYDFLRNLEKAPDKIRPETLVHAARISGFPARDLFLFARRHHLRPMLDPEFELRQF